MTFHTNRRTPAQGARCANKGRTRNSRIVVTLPNDDMACLCWWAAKKGVPAATVLRNAVWSYLQCVRGDFEREQATSDAGLASAGSGNPRVGELNISDQP